MTAIQVENLSKAYQLGKIGTGTISRDLERFFVTKILGKEDPFLKIGQTNDRSVKGTSDIVWSLKDINFSINQGEAVGIIGKNGAGKSTLLKILSRVTSPTTGNIKIKGRVASLLEVGTGFHPELSGRENIYLNGAILGMRKAEIKRKFDEIVDFAGVERYIDTPVKRYSSGMYVRLAFAVAAHLESEILVVDEVLAVGDAEFQKKCLGKMGDISKGEGRTILFVSHNMVAVQNLCDKGILLENGMVVLDNKIDLVVGNYLNSSIVNKNEVVADVFDVKRSNGKYKIIKKVWIENSKGEIVNNLWTGESFSVKFAFESDFELDNLDFGFGIENEFGIRISSLNNSVLGKKSKITLSRGTACLDIINPNFNEGVYYLSLSVVRNGLEWIDYVEQAHTFSIEASDVYNSGKLISKNQGQVFINGNITVI